MDTLKFSRGLQNVGFTAQQAEFLADNFLDLVDDQLVTKSHHDNSLLQVRGDIAQLKAEVDLKLKDVDLKIAEVKRDLEVKLAAIELKISNVELKISQVEVNILKWLVPILIAQGSAIVALIKWL